MPTDERVLVIPEDHFRRVGFFRGFQPADDAYRAALLAPAAFSFTCGIFQSDGLPDKRTTNSRTTMMPPEYTRS